MQLIENEAGGRLRSSLHVAQAGPIVRAAVVSDAITGRNGVGTYYTDLVAQLAPRLERIELLAPDSRGEAVPNWFSMPMPGDATQRLFWPKRRAVTSLLDRFEPTVVVIPTLGALSFLAMRYARHRRLPTLVVNHTNLDELLQLYWHRTIAQSLGWGLQRFQHWMMRRATRLAAVDEEGARQARQLTSTSVPILGTPISNAYLEQPTREPSRDIRRVIFVGRLAKEKGIDQMLAAAHVYPDIEFSIVGDGPLRGFVEQATSTCANLKARGWLRRSQVLEAMDAADLLVLPSEIETFGTVALEALARRRYVIVRETCGIARNPFFSPGLLKMGAREPLAAMLGRVLAMDAEARWEQCRQGWDAVRQFNDETLDQWATLLGTLSQMSNRPMSVTARS